MINQIDNFFNKIILILICAILVLTVGLCTFSICARWFSLSFLWIDPLVRHFVLVLTFLGGAQAITDKQHISIDLINRYLEKIDNSSMKNWVEFTQDCFMFVGLGVLFYAGYKFLHVEIEYGKEEFLQIHSSVLVGILPFGFALMLLKQILKMLQSYVLKNVVGTPQ